MCGQQSLRFVHDEELKNEEGKVGRWEVHPIPSHPVILHFLSWFYPSGGLFYFPVGVGVWKLEMVGIQPSGLWRVLRVVCFLVGNATLWRCVDISFFLVLCAIVRDLFDGRRGEFMFELLTLLYERSDIWERTSLQLKRGMKRKCRD